MKKIWHIALNDIFLMVKDKIFLFWGLAFPMVFIVLFGTVFKYDQTSVNAALTIQNKDTGKWGAYFIEKLKAPSIDIILVKELPKEYNRILVLPADFSSKIEGMKAQQLHFIKKSEANVKAAAQVETKIIQAIAKIITELILYGDKDLKAFFDQKPGFKNILEVKTGFPENTITKIPSGFDHAIPGTIVQFIIMMVLIYGGVSVMEDRKRGVLSRILFSPVSIPGLFGGKFLGRLMMGLVQAGILIITGILFFHLNLGNIPLSLLNLLVFSLSISSLSILIGSIFGKEDLIVGVSVLLSNLFAALGGCWWPIEVVPGTFKTLGFISPAYWAMDTFHQIIFFNKGLADIWVNLAVLLGFTAVFTFLAVKFFKIKAD